MPSKPIRLLIGKMAPRIVTAQPEKVRVFLVAHLREILFPIQMSMHIKDTHGT